MVSGAAFQSLAVSLLTLSLAALDFESSFHIFVVVVLMDLPPSFLHNNTKNCCVLMLLILYSLTFSDPFSLKVGDDAFPSPDI